jgi:hypothetical protein
MRTKTILFSLLLLPFAGLRAQADFAKDEAELQKKASVILVRFAENATRNKVGPRAKQAYDLVLDHYDLENAAARHALGFTKVKDKWEQGALDKRPKWEDKANNEQRYKVIDEWYKTAMQLGALHRELGLKMMKGENLVRGGYHLELAVGYNPMDVESHKALGHTETKGFWGTEVETAFVARMKEIETKALELAKKEYEVTPLPAGELPEELKRTGLEFHGVKTAHNKIWTRGTQENADNCGKWAERGLDFLVYLMGEDKAKRFGVAQRVASRGWVGFIWTTMERDDFLKLNPQIYEGKTIEDAKLFANVQWKSATGPATVYMRLTPAQMHDNLIVQMFEYGLTGGANKALAEGLNHAATWYLMSTSITHHGARPEGTVTGRELQLPESTNWWMRHMRDQALAGSDYPINQCPREPLSQFRNDVRVKVWSFMTWVLAAYPDKWLDFFTKIPPDHNPGPDEVDALGEKVFGKKLAEVEGEWRKWARGDSGIAAATGYGPPLLPEKPGKEELVVLERMNLIRRQAIAYSVPEGKKEIWQSIVEGQLGPLPTCDLDAEATMACDDHAKYLTRWTEEHMKWPEAHEENPAREGFSPRGMRAAQRSVIVFLNANGGVDFARDSVDGWIGTVYHRFPLLEHNINRFGYSYVYENGWSVAVLDMGSLEEPYDPRIAPRFVAWPPPGMKEVPLAFHGHEMPNPLDDQPEADRDILATGYPVSLQLQREFAMKLAKSELSLYVVPKPERDKVPAQNVLFVDTKGNQADDWRKRCGDPVACWIHTPAVPLLKRMEVKNCVFGIPKAHLRPSTTYQVRVQLQIDNPQPIVFCWEFTTGTHKEGLKLKEPKEPKK